MGAPDFKETSDAKPLPIFLLTDFGDTDHYVAAMKAVILARCPDATLIDIAHDLLPQAIAAGCYLLESIAPWLPAKSIVVGVVDPGVGTAREPAVFCDNGRIYIGPNNGLFGFLPTDTPGRVLDRPRLWLPDPSHTFHGRDIFAPCAAWVATGLSWQDLGDNSTSPVRLPNDQDPAILPGREGRIVYFDHFGNGITNIAAAEISSRGEAIAVEIPGKLRCPAATTFSDVQPGKPIAYAGSTGRVEIAVRNGNAQAALGLELGDPVRVLNP